MRQALFVLAALTAIAAPGAAQAQPYYQGKTLRILVGVAPGGGFDTYARVVGRHLGRHIPGNPSVIVDNMPGAGSILMANHLYHVAKPDGLTVGHFSGMIILGQVLGQRGIQFDARGFEYLGAAARENVVCSLTRASGIASLEQWRLAGAPVKLGGVAPGSASYNAAKILQAALGLPIQVVSGYKGTSQIRLAAESGELAGGCWSWESMRATWRKALETGEVVPVVQVAPRPFPGTGHVPLAIDFATSEEARGLIQIGVHDSSALARPFALSPGTPRRHVAVLRKAFLDTLEDPAFAAEAQKAHLMIDPVSGEALAKLIAELFTLDSAVLARLKAALER